MEMSGLSAEAVDRIVEVAEAMAEEAEAGCRRGTSCPSRTGAVAERSRGGWDCRARRRADGGRRRRRCAEQGSRRRRAGRRKPAARGAGSSGRQSAESADVEPTETGRRRGETGGASPDRASSRRADRLGARCGRRDVRERSRAASENRIIGLVLAGGRPENGGKVVLESCGKCPARPLPQRSFSLSCRGSRTRLGSGESLKESPTWEVQWTHCGDGGMILCDSNRPLNPPANRAIPRTKLNESSCSLGGFPIELTGFSPRARTHLRARKRTESRQ